MNYFKIIILVFFFFISTAEAGKISEIFGESVFGVSWEDNIKKIQKRYPDGELKGTEGSLQYVVKDSRELLGITFAKNNLFTYVFNQDSLTHIDISFSEKGVKKFGQLKDALISAFGDANVTQPTTGVVMMKWQEDNGVVLSLIYSSGLLGSDIHLNIQNTANSSKIISKESLGFN